LTRRAVAIGGGTGLPMVLRCLLNLGHEATAIVTMADDGGSSGLLREQLGMLPPGDVRNCLVALSDPESLPSRLFQYRFPHGEGLAGHALGNLIIAALADITRGFPEAIEAASGLLGSRGRVLPCTLADVRLLATDAEGATISGQARLARSAGPFADIRLEPELPPAYAPAIEAISSADVLVIGPGSLFTSILPNLLVAGVVQAIRESGARRVYVCNVANQRGETSGMDAYDHVKVLVDYGLEGVLDVVLVHRTLASTAPGEQRRPTGVIEAVTADKDVEARIAELTSTVLAMEMTDARNPYRHSYERLERGLAEAIG